MNSKPSTDKAFESVSKKTENFEVAEEGKVNKP